MSDTIKREPIKNFIEIAINERIDYEEKLKEAIQNAEYINAYRYELMIYVHKWYIKNLLEALDKAKTE